MENGLPSFAKVAVGECVIDEVKLISEAVFQHTAVLQSFAAG